MHRLPFVLASEAKSLISQGILAIKDSNQSSTFLQRTVVRPQKSSNCRNMQVNYQLHLVYLLVIDYFCGLLYCVRQV
jgi:hypothetical protein